MLSSDRFDAIIGLIQIIGLMQMIGLMQFYGLHPRPSRWVLPPLAQQC